MIKNGTGINVSVELRNKIKRATVANDMTMVDYLDSVIPDIKIEEVKK